MLTRKVNDRLLPFQGLTSAQVKLNREKYGANILTPPEREPLWKLFLAKFEDPVIRILMIAAAIAISVGIFEGEYAEGLGIVAAILLATTLAFANEYKASKEFDILNQVYDEVFIKVIRDNSFTTVKRKDLVFGDVVYVEQGEEIPTDGQILEEISLEIDQSKITGEAEPVKKLTQSDAENQGIEEGTYPAYKIYRSTIVEQGEGYFEVTAVGDNTEIGKLATAITSIENTQDTPLNHQLEKLSKLIGVVGLGFAGFTFVSLLVRGFVTKELSLSSQQWYVVGLSIISVLIALSRVWLPVVYDGLELAGSKLAAPKWLENNSFLSWLKRVGIVLVFFTIGLGLGYPLGLIPSSINSWVTSSVAKALLHYFMVAVTIIVVAVPEGLAMSVTLSLAYSMKKMAASNNLVRRMHACETIGSATVICSDKTGTLTQNQMRVYEVNFPSLNSQLLPALKDVKGLIAEAIAVNSTADLEKKPLQPSRPIGNPTEGALLLWLDSQDIDYISYRGNFQIKSRMPFSGHQKYMATIGISSVTGEDVLYVKGAPEVILERCSQILTEQGLESLKNKAAIASAIKEYQKRGMRALGFAYHNVSQHSSQTNLDELAHDMTWLGFVAISDPLRPEVPDAIQACLRAGIEVKVVTGDNSETAKEIARQIGLWQEEDDFNSGYLHLTGQQFAQLSDEEANQAVLQLKVLSRARPLDKLRLVKLLQENGQVVGVTGDGTNDAAALKQAQVGLAMGSGTAIAKEASDIILLDDSFHSIVNAVVWGRSLYLNIQRFILFQLTINVVALGIALIGPFIGVALPLTVTQMLWVNLIMDTFAALALATEPPHLSVMQHSPRNPQAFIVTKAMAQNIFTVGLAFLIFLVGFLRYIRRDGEITPYELSVFFGVFVMLQFWNLFNARCLGLKQSAFKGLSKNKGFVAIAITIFVGQILIIQFGGNVFRTVPLSFVDWISVIVGTSTVLFIGELWRFIMRLKLKSHLRESY
ncbi:calcium-translocating P-type ATPase, PMCA-type [Nostoc sp. 'Peltigera membranacea cyanobiont' 210A]|uniref:calcium-translocating P-type ATPase, PMCA-type n=1 Tax=Nostoc sp. 'Peltigera membranacea cyanobiont' 210A TaxID=2014529 RepID=UPI000B9506AD|nr:calcium-translocating P-type ATPase, PMCA-type [Nostoc sp. 'Peltigera membranacea cyanobiont' 210A]OYD92114.1 calcium-translocating P-type ATPase, PMCA-type [Nostoc sp. 'Peltigera membranacea cyanobiont' 210A]